MPCCQGMTTEDNPTSSHPSSGPTSNVGIRHADPLRTLEDCLEPVKMLVSPSFHNAAEGGGKSLQDNNDCNEENGLSQNVSKLRASPSRSGTGADPYKCNAAKVRASIKSSENRRRPRMLESRRALVVLAMANDNKDPLLDGICCNLIRTRGHRGVSPRMALLLFLELTSIHDVKTKMTTALHV